MIPSTLTVDCQPVCPSVHCQTKHKLKGNIFLSCVEIVFLSSSKKLHKKPFLARCFHTMFYNSARRYIDSQFYYLIIVVIFITVLRLLCLIILQRDVIARRLKATSSWFTCSRQHSQRVSALRPVDPITELNLLQPRVPTPRARLCQLCSFDSVFFNALMNRCYF